MLVVGNRKNEQALLQTYQSSVVPDKLKVITDYDELWGWANNVIYNRLNPNKDLYFKPTTPTPVEQQAQQAPVVEPVVEVKPVEKENDDLFASLGDEQPVSPLEDIASSVTPTSAVTMFDEVVVAKEEEIKQEEAVKPKPMFGRKPKSKPNKVSFDFGTVEVSTQTTSSDDDVPTPTEATPTFENENDNDFVPEVKNPHENQNLDEDLDDDVNLQVGDTTATNEGETPEQTPAEEPAVEQVKQEPGLTAEEIAKLNSELAIGTEQKEEPTVESDQSNLQPIVPVPNAENTTEPTPENIYQVKYIPMSMASEPIALVAKNQIKAINQANAQLTTHIQNVLGFGGINFQAEVDNGNYPTLVDAYVAK